NQKHVALHQTIAVSVLRHRRKVIRELVVIPLVVAVPREARGESLALCGSRRRGVRLLRRVLFHRGPAIRRRPLAVPSAFPVSGDATECGPAAAASLLQASMSAWCGGSALARSANESKKTTVITAARRTISSSTSSAPGAGNAFD